MLLGALQHGNQNASDIQKQLLCYQKISVDKGSLSLPIIKRVFICARLATYRPAVGQRHQHGQVPSGI